MRIYSSSPAFQRTLVLALPFTAAVWLVTVPGVVTISSLLGVAGLVIALLWVTRTTYANGQPTASLSQAVSIAPQGAAREPRPDRR